MTPKTLLGEYMYHSKIKALIRNRGGDNDDFCGTQAEDQFL